MLSTVTYWNGSEERRRETDGKNRRRIWGAESHTPASQLLLEALRAVIILAAQTRTLQQRKNRSLPRTRGRNKSQGTGQWEATWQGWLLSPRPCVEGVGRAGHLFRGQHQLRLEITPRPRSSKIRGLGPGGSEEEGSWEGGAWRAEPACAPRRAARAPSTIRQAERRQSGGQGRGQGMRNLAGLSLEPERVRGCRPRGWK